MSGSLVSLTVTWMDGQEETYRVGSGNVRVVDGVLYLTQDRYPRSDDPDRAIPLANVRIWEAAE